MKKGNIIKAEEWFKIGRDELRAAEIMMKEQGLYSQVCFYCHQSVEKYMKGFLTLNGKNLEKIHDLGELNNFCLAINKGFDKFSDDCEILNQFYIPTRYPMHYEIHKKEVAVKAFKIAKEIIEFIKKETKI